MRSPHAGVITVLLALCITPVASRAEPADAVSAQVAEDLKGIRQALDRLVAASERAEQDRKIDLLLRRIEWRERRLVPLEQRVETARTELRKIEDHLAQLAMLKDQGEERLADEIGDGLDAQRSEARRMLDEIERTRQTQEQRQEQAVLRARQLEDELAERRRSIEILEDELLDLLEEK